MRDPWRAEGRPLRRCRCGAAPPGRFGGSWAPAPAGYSIPQRPFSVGHGERLPAHGCTLTLFDGSSVRIPYTASPSHKRWLAEGTSFWGVGINRSAAQYERLTALDRRVVVVVILRGERADSIRPNL